MYDCVVRFEAQCVERISIIITGMRVEWECPEGGRWGKLSNNPCIHWTFIIHESSSNIHPLICLYDITLFFSIIKMDFKCSWFMDGAL
jgi:hypothetical protein